MASGEFREVAPATAGRLLLSTLNQMARWIKPDGPSTPRQVIEEYLDIILVGLKAPGTAHAAKPAGRKAATRS